MVDTSVCTLDALLVQSFPRHGFDDSFVALEALSLKGSVHCCLLVGTICHFGTNFTSLGKQPSWGIGFLGLINRCLFFEEYLIMKIYLK